MSKFAFNALLPALVLVAGTAEAQQHLAVGIDSPTQLYAKCTTVGTDEYDGQQCIAFRAAAEQEISACMSAGASNRQGYRALRLKCAEQQTQRFSHLVD